MRAQLRTEQWSKTLHRWGAGRQSAVPLLKPFRWAAWGAFVSGLVWSSPTTRGFRLRALVRLWCWQVWRRFPGGSIELDLSYGARLWLPPWSSLAGVVAAAGTHEPAEQAFFLHFLRPGDGVVDVGANLGLYTVPAIVAGAYVAAFEPVETAREVLLHNIRLNCGEPRAKVFPFALAARQGVGEITTDLESSNRVLGAEHYVGSSTSVLVRTLDDTVAESAEWFDEHGCQIMKIDAEGLDAEVLRGAETSISRWKPVLLVEAWAGGKEIRSLLGAHGYRVYRYDCDDRSLVEYPDDWGGDGNLIAVPDSALGEVTGRVASGRCWEERIPRARWLRRRSVGGA